MFKPQVIIGHPCLIQQNSGVDLKGVGVEHLRACSPAVILNFGSNELLLKKKI